MCTGFVFASYNPEVANYVEMKWQEKGMVDY